MGNPLCRGRIKESHPRFPQACVHAHTPPYGRHPRHGRQRRWVRPAPMSVLSHGAPYESITNRQPLFQATPAHLGSPPNATSQGGRKPRRGTPKPNNNYNQLKANIRQAFREGKETLVHQAFLSQGIPCTRAKMAFIPFVYKTL